MTSSKKTFLEMLHECHSEMESRSEAFKKLSGKDRSDIGFYWEGFGSFPKKTPFYLLNTNGLDFEDIQTVARIHKEMFGE